MERFTRWVYRVPEDKLLEAYELLPDGFEIVSRRDGVLEIALYTEGGEPKGVPFELVSKEELTLGDWREYYKPVEVADAMVIPPWENPENFKGKTVLVINPGKAFGTGLHESTRLCLRLLSELELRGKTVLDVGSGSGILSVYALKKGAAFVKAIDIDPFAVEETLENAKKNGVADRIEVCQCPPSEVEGIFDLVVANLELRIFEGVLKDITPKVGRVALFSGLYLRRELERFEELLRETSLRVKKVEGENGWFALLTERV